MSIDPIILAVVIGIAVGGSCFLVAVVALMFCNRHNEGNDNGQQRRRGKGTNRKTEMVESPAVSPAGDQRVSTVIKVTPTTQEDISTLGDPVYPHDIMVAAGMNMTMNMDDETDDGIGTNGDYDYAKAFKGDTNSTPSSSLREASDVSLPFGDRPDEEETNIDSGRYTNGTGTSTISRLMSKSLFSDNMSFEQQYHSDEQRILAVAPAGKLGVVIDTATGTIPMVHAIKDTSPLFPRVQVGDRLISIDDEDTTTMTAMEVSQILRMKSQNPTRTLVFIRTITDDR